MKRNILITTPKLSTSGGVSSFWSALLPEFSSYKEMKIDHLEIGGHKKNIFGPFLDQWNFRRKIKQEVELAILNPSLGSRSFFRDALFAKQLAKKQIAFLVFFHGWNLNFEKKIDTKYINFFLATFGQAKKIFVLSKYFKNKILGWGYKGDVIVETTNVESSLVSDFFIEKKITKIKKSTKIKILFLARLFKEKGIFEMVEAFRNLADKYNNINLTIAGDGKALNILRDKVKNNPNINVVGYVEGKSKIDLFIESHIYCLPSYSEGLPISVLEAMAFAMPVITTPVGGLKDFFQNGKMGYFVDPKSTKQLEEKLELLLLNTDKIIEIGKYNYNYANEKLLSNVVAKRLYKHILSVLEQK